MILLVILDSPFFYLICIYGHRQTMKKQIRNIISLTAILGAFFSANLFAQTTTREQAQQAAMLGNAELEAQEKAQLANASKDYPVTAGDVYQLSFAAGNTPISYTIPVDSSYTIKVANLATLNGAGKTFMQLKAQVEAIVNRNYPMGGVQFYILKPSVFSIVVKGEVTKTQVKSSWAMNRLSTILQGDYLTEFSSTRFVQIVSKDGKARDFDLYKTLRDGDLSQDPYVRPEDTIIIKRFDRKVTVAGEVERPGVYELLPGENLKQLIENYGNGLKSGADLSRVSLIRIRDAENPSGNTLYLSGSAISSNYELKNYDSVYIPGFSELRPSIVLEGIIQNPEHKTESEEDTAAAEAGTKETQQIRSYKEVVYFYEGENYSPFLKRISTKFTNYSDLENAYIVRNGQKITVNISSLLRNYNTMSDLYVMKDDHLVIPYSQNFSNKILINGEVTQVQEVSAWPLRRLSEIIRPLLTEFSSTRNITITDPEGRSSTCDLFKATRFGDMTQNPYIQSGCTITINRYARKVSISGGVERPGTYELLDGENFKELYQIYAGGLLNRADKTRTELFRKYDTAGSNGRKIYLKETVFDSNYILFDKDSFFIPTYDDLMQVAFLEGAVKIDINEEEDAKGTALISSNKVSIEFTEGENYAYFVRRNRNRFTDSSDLKNAYILREGKAIPFNLETILYSKNYATDLEVQAYDVLMVPFEQSFVTVAGAVQVPGRYPYIPDRTWDYYIGLAGGFDKNRNAGDMIKITDKNNKKYSKKNFITPESTITAETTAFTFYFNKYAPIITTVLSAITTTISIIAITKN